MIGHTLVGRYELLARVGGGGMALVYKAKDILLNRFVAVKVLRQQFMHDEDFVKRFRREAQAAASLSHPNIVSIYDVGQEEDTHYIVMEYIDGANLNEIIRDRAPLQVEEAVRIASQICDALDHAHHNQIIHRDIKPHNILIGNNGRVKVTDFGIARAVTSSTITQTGSVVGSVHYFSPEHAKGVATGEKSDIYSLGIVLYQMLTGRLPFLGESPISVALKHLQEPFEQPRKVNPHIPQSVENVILRAMRKNPQERYSSASRMLADLETCLQPQRINEPAVQFDSDDEEEEKTRVIPAIRSDMRSSLDSQTIVSGNSQNQWNSDGLEEERKKRWVLPTVLGVLAALLIAVLVWAVFALKEQLTPADVVPPTVIGSTETEARAALEAKGFVIQEPTIYQANKDVAKDLVIDQSKKDIPIKEGSSIQLTVSTGPDLPVIPKLTGKTYEDAVEELKLLGIAEDSIHKKEAYDSSEPGTVLEQSIEPDATFDQEKGDEITLTVSKGKEEFAMPNLINKSESEARAEIQKNDLKLPDKNVFREPSYAAPKGKVFKQFPAEQNETVSAGTEVSIWISTGYPPEAKEKSWEVTVPPAEEGKESTIRILYSDARGDNIEWGTPRKIKAVTTFPIKLILSPDKSGQITVYRNNEYLDRIPVPYNDVPAASTIEPPSPAPNDGGGESESPVVEDQGTD
ncbi:Stk1 family PASTA domain-containing Ser/Thr kinase [Cohnella faecalis]|uniref:Serine/threonine-protein kinase PrkC n=1 Tax=Cohnella faecalis TaxID=2315694 RepID=A0A398CZP3_9BACL|nr:Stk1 family PASTA domain-containing Ser/Thr kinase [Cohnella faecalis]RIE04394.1 Stk1 family PASTA domain-containing Ser/Thr kinase [Cohnella faecalis]